MDAMPVPQEVVLQHVEKMLASPVFVGALRSRALLTFVVQQALAGNGGFLKEYTIGAEALARGDDFDPRTDPIVRAEASRLRTRIDRYYATDGATDPIVISLPKGSYVPEFTARTVEQSHGTALHASGSAVPAVTAAAAERHRLTWLAIGAVAGVTMSGALGLLAWNRFQPIAASAELVRFEVELTRGPQTLGSDFGPDIAISPDGRQTAFVVRSADGQLRLMARAFDAAAATELPDTAGARAPFFSPDGRWVGFWANGTVKKVAVDGGVPMDLAPAVDFGGAAWDDDGIVATIARTLVRIPPGGGQAVVIADLSADDISLGWPDVLPAGTHALVTALSITTPPSVIAVDLKDGTRTTMVPNGTYARVLESGHLLYANQGTLFAMPFDLRTRVPRGTAVPVLENIEFASTFGVAQVALSRTGTLVYRQSTARGQLVADWVDEAGLRTPFMHGREHSPSGPSPQQAARPMAGTDRLAGVYTFPRLSPDGSRLALATVGSGSTRIAVYDARNDRMDTLPPAPASVSPVWMPDGRFLVFGTAQGLRWARADDPSRTAVLVAHGGVQVPWSFTPDGQRLAYAEISPSTGFDLWTVPVRVQDDGLVAGTPEVFLQTNAFETYPAFSPDGRWMAYGSGRYGAWEVYVRPFPAGQGREVRVSDGGGRIAHWLPDGRLAYRTDDHRLMVVDFTVRDGALVPGRPRQWIATRLANTGVLGNFDVSADGLRVLALMPAAASDLEQSRNHVTVILNFGADVARRLRTAPSPRAGTSPR